MRNDEVKAREVNLKFAHVGMKAFMQLRAFTGDVIQILRVEAIIIGSQSSGMCLNSARENLFADARNPKLVTLLDKLLERRW